MMEWRPIETAPMDETHVLLSNGFGVWAGFYGYSKKLRLGNWRHCRGHTCIPTHWMPMPDPPK